MKKTNLTGCEALRALADGYEVKDRYDNKISYVEGKGFDVYWRVRDKHLEEVRLQDPPYSIVEKPLNTREMLRALADGKKLRLQIWCEKEYICLDSEGTLVDETGEKLTLEYFDATSFYLVD